MNKHAVCNSCGTKTPLKQVIFCQACQQTPYCSAKCRTKDVRFHERDCEPQDVIQAADFHYAEKNEEKKKGHSGKRKFDVSSSSGSGSGEESDENILILEVMKDRIDKEVVDDLTKNVFSRRTRQQRKVIDSEESEFED